MLRQASGKVVAALIIQRNGVLFPDAVNFGEKLTRTINGDLRQSGKRQKIAKKLLIAVQGDILAVIFHPQRIDAGKINILSGDQVDDLTLIFVEGRRDIDAVFQRGSCHIRHGLTAVFGIVRITIFLTGAVGCPCPNIRDHTNQ
jgi:hypothetical protein